MIFSPLIVVASELGIAKPAKSKAGDGSSIVRTYRRVTESGLGSVIVDSTNDVDAQAAAAQGAYTVKSDLGEINNLHNYRSNSGAERIAATVNRFDRFYTHDVVIAVADDMEELQPFYLQALMYALASTEVGIATLVSPLKAGERDDREIPKAAVSWNSERIVHPLEGSRVGTLLDIRRDAGALHTPDCYKLVPIHAWRRAALDRIIRMPPSEREFSEGTDLVRAVEAGIRIDVALVSEDMRVLISPKELEGGLLEG